MIRRSINRHATTEDGDSLFINEHFLLIHLASRSLHMSFVVPALSSTACFFIVIQPKSKRNSYGTLPRCFQVFGSVDDLFVCNLTACFIHFLSSLQHAFHSFLLAIDRSNHFPAVARLSELEIPDALDDDELISFRSQTAARLRKLPVHPKHLSSSSLQPSFSPR